MDTQRGHSVASRCLGGRDEPVRPDVTTSSAKSRRWIPPSSYRRDAITDDEKYDEIFRTVRGILNKLTPEKFSKLSDELLNTGLDSKVILKGVILLIFEKALDEPKYSSLYSQLCRKLCDSTPEFGVPSNNSNTHSSNENTFRSLLLKKCQDEFENRSKATEAFDKKYGLLTAEEEEQRGIAKHKMLGNITFIGELGKQGLLPERIIHQCIKNLLSKKNRQTCKDMAEDLECLCQIMKTVGRRLDTNKAKALMDQYFDRIVSYASNEDLPSRIRFMLQDVIELRRNKWVPRQIHSENSPRTIRQIHEAAAKEYGFYIPTMQQNNSVSSNLFSGYGGPLGISRNRVGGMDDVFDSVIMGTSRLGIGPGVIDTDRFNGYQPDNFGVRSNRTGFGQNQPYGGFNRQQSTGFGQSQSQQNYSMNSTLNNKNMPPRLKKNQLPSTGRNMDEISLRPAQNSMILKPKTQIQNNNNGIHGSSHSIGGNITSTMQNTVISQMANATMSNQASVLIKQDKQKSNKTVITKEEVVKRTETLISDYLNDQQTSDDVIAALKEMKIPKKLNMDVLHVLMNNSSLKGEIDSLSILLCDMKKESIIVSSSSFLESYKQLLSEMIEMESEVPRIKSHVAGLGARAIGEDICCLEDVFSFLETGSYYPLFLLLLQQLNKSKGKDWLTENFNNSKIVLLNLMPDSDRTNERLLEVLDDRGLGFLLPLLRIQADLKKRMKIDPSPNCLYSWIKENVDQTLHVCPEFINLLSSCLIKYITEETTLSVTERNAQPEKILVDKEKDVLIKYKLIFQAFLHDHVDLQVVVLYALQVYCHGNDFPKGMLLRWFMMFYDLEIVEEESFLKWKEDVNDNYPGKGKALFQVNQWLTWLEEAEEEDEEDDDDDGSDND